MKKYIGTILLPKKTKPDSPIIMKELKKLTKEKRHDLQGHEDQIELKHPFLNAETNMISIQAYGPPPGSVKP